MLALHAWSSQPIVYLPVIGGTVLALVLLRKPATGLYVGLMPLINWSFAAVPLIPLPLIGAYQPLAIVTGLVLVVRDFAQREIGHWVLGAMLVGLLFSTMTTPLSIVAASGAAFLISETVDWAVYTFTKRPLSQRIMLSSLLGAPLDSTVFLFGANIARPGSLALGTLLTSIVSKLVGAFIVALLVARRERNEAAQIDMKAA
ncbi:MAG: VUT family protein [Hyphomonadaceae bacterium]|nr:VUT family protein [Hyphomonadaceae bacterium]